MNPGECLKPFRLNERRCQKLLKFVWTQNQIANETSQSRFLIVGQLRCPPVTREGENTTPKSCAMLGAFEPRRAKTGPFSQLRPTGSD